jgi:hypothetical protein
MNAARRWIELSELDIKVLTEKALPPVPTLSEIAFHLR